MKFLYILRAKAKSATIQSTRGNPFSELEKVQIMAILNENANISACLSESKKSVSVYYTSLATTNDSENELPFDLEGFIRDALPRKESKSEIMRKEKLLIGEEKRAICKKQTIQYVKDNNGIKEWIDSLFGECTLNTYNICALIRFFKGEDSEFNGLLNWKCLNALKDNDLASVDGELYEHQFKDYFKANYKGCAPLDINPINEIESVVCNEPVEITDDSLSNDYANVTADTYIYFELAKTYDNAWIELSDIILKNNCGDSTVLHANSCSHESDGEFDSIKMCLLTDYNAVSVLSDLDMSLSLTNLNNVTATVKVNDGDIGYENMIIKASIMFPSGEDVPLNLIY
ncbi:hypothetical protein EIJ81_01060 (plasmid) [Aliivibrio salmonicida]|uniref:hypothetical protein n=1 Tax=Aliivibrio salmonicida TaxID=40269 RepID=UPI000F718002|nr:hypothetical protein [Aliivibrio salmonicida]AZL83489.1 hypothetical protein EIJ81_01060 [Aliivibrio salmonicida]